MERKQLTESQRLLLQIYRQRIEEAINFVRQRQNEMQNIIDLIAIELGIPQEQFSEWRLVDNERFEKIESKAEDKEAGELTE